MIAPAGQFHEAISLTLRRALAQWQAARFGENGPVFRGLDDDGGIGGLGHGHEAGGAQVGPRAVEGEVIFDRRHG